MVPYAPPTKFNIYTRKLKFLSPNFNVNYNTFRGEKEIHLNSKQCLIPEFLIFKLERSKAIDFFVIKLNSVVLVRKRTIIAVNITHGKLQLLIAQSHDIIFFDIFNFRKGKQLPP
jgi:hypothetical protein